MARAPAVYVITLLPRRAPRALHAIHARMHAARARQAKDTRYRAVAGYGRENAAEMERRYARHLYIVTKRERAAPRYAAMMRIAARRGGGEEDGINERCNRWRSAFAESAFCARRQA